ncbi:MAG: hypothetical protein KIT14_15745 [bacterium]|nr:hypothetical protein [bacterium]
MAPGEALRHRPFVEHFYLSHPSCRLHLLMADDGSIAGILGIARMRFEWNGAELTMAFGANFHALRPGAGGLLYLHWTRSAPVGLVFGGSTDAHRIYREQKWVYFPGARVMMLNPEPLQRPGDPLWRRVARQLRARVQRKPIGRYGVRLPAAARGVTVREEARWDEALLPRRSPFALRYAPPLDELTWRYALDLPHVRYRLFRVSRDGTPCGYVVLQDRPERILVAHADGEDPGALAGGIVRAVLAVGGTDRTARSVVLASTCPTMREVFLDVGFRVRAERPLAMRAFRPSQALPADPGGWLVSFDWGDNGLRTPFLDQPAVPA